MKRIRNESQRQGATLRVISPIQHATLVSFGRYHFLTHMLLGWLLDHSPNSARHDQKLLHSLTDLGLLLSVPVPRLGRYGRPALCYCLSRRGINYLCSHGIPIKQRFHPSEQRAYSYQHLQHTLELNSVLIGAERLCRSHPTLELRTVRHERDLRGEAAVVGLPNGEKHRVSTDAWLDIRLGSRQMPVAVELDHRGTEHVGAWKSKVQRLVAWANGPYVEQFQTSFLTIAVIAVGGDSQRRCANLRRWTGAALADLGAVEQGDLFRFTSLPIDPARTEVEGLLVSPRWSAPFSTEVGPLLDGATEAN